LTSSSNAKKGKRKYFYLIFNTASHDHARNVPGDTALEVAECDNSPDAAAGAGVVHRADDAEAAKVVY